MVSNGSFDEKASGNYNILKEDLSIRICECFSSTSLLTRRIAENRINPKLITEWFETFCNVYYATCDNLKKGTNKKDYEDFIDEMMEGDCPEGTVLVKTARSYFKDLKKAGILNYVMRDFSSGNSYRGSI